MQEATIKTENQEYKGILVKEDDNFFTLKLSSGYNISIKKSKVKSINKGKKVSQAKNLAKEKHADYMILHTGGTIASRVDYNTGSVIAQFSPDEIIANNPELKEVGKFGSVLVSNIMSEAITFKHYNKIAKAIKKEVDAGCKGIIVTHGTDFLHSTAAALSFALENVPVPVVFVGSQRSSDRGSSDASSNLICAARVLKEKKNGIFIVMHASSNDDKCSIISGLNARKMHTSRRDAFVAVNDTPLGEVDIKTGEVNWFKEPIVIEGKFSLKLFKEVRVGIIKTRPNMFAEEFAFFKKYDGLIIEGSGIGNAPVMSFDKESGESEKIYDAIKKLKIPIGLTSQTVFGRINMEVYSVSRRLKEAGVMGNQLDMSTETAYVKLAWLLSNHPKKIRELYEENLRGEISERSEQRDYHGL